MSNSVATDVPTKPRSGRRAPVIVLFVLLVAAGGFLVWREKFETYHLATVQAGVL